eukprot:COSAG03_NODE_1505_length_3970_cov_2.229915_1_plen_225_part_00
MWFDVTDEWKISHFVAGDDPFSPHSAWCFECGRSGDGTLPPMDGWEPVLDQFGTPKFSVMRPAVVGGQRSRGEPTSRAASSSSVTVASEEELRDALSNSAIQTIVVRAEGPIEITGEGYVQISRPVSIRGESGAALRLAKPLVCGTYHSRSDDPVQIEGLTLLNDGIWVNGRQSVEIERCVIQNVASGAGIYVYNKGSRASVRRQHSLHTLCLVCIGMFLAAAF